MGIRFKCPNGHRLHVKSQLGGQVGLCPECKAKVLIPKPTEASTDSQSANHLEHLARQAEPSGDESISLKMPSGEAPVSSEPEAPSPDRPLEVRTPEPAPQAVPRAIPRAKAIAVAKAMPAQDPAPAAPQAPEIRTNEQPPASTPPKGPEPTQWHLQTGAGEQLGPGDAQELSAWAAEGRLTGDSYVWRTGWSDWRQVAEIRGELPIASQAAAAAPKVVGEPQVASAASRYASKRKRAAKRQKYVALILLSMVATVAVVMTIVLQGGWQQPNTETPDNPIQTPQDEQLDAPAVEQPDAAQPDDEADDAAMDPI